LQLDAIFTQIADEAPQRDVERDHPHELIAALKKAGLGRARLSPEQGGLGLSLCELFDLVQDLAYADSNVAHIFRNHLFAVEEALRLPQEPYYARLLDEAAQGHSFGLGFGLAPVKRAGQIPDGVTGRLNWNEDDGAYQGTGIKLYSTGNLYADWLLGPAQESREGKQVRYLVSTQAPGVNLTDDWSGFGQKLTGSGNTRFVDARIEAHNLYPPPVIPEHDGTWSYTFHQIYLTTIIAGIARRIKTDAIALLKKRSRNFYHGQADEPRNEAVLQAQLGQLAAHVAAIDALVKRAALALQTGFAAYGTAFATERMLEATLKAVEAKIVADSWGPQVASNLLDLGSGSVVTIDSALDRHWRNIKVIAAHNPSLYKTRFLGDHLLNQTLPPTGAFF
jgi:alkylation response protein AidB-like acyl-CoA dehydrogenase